MIKEYRVDGWPLCPNCGEDELYSLFSWDGSDPKPPMQAWIDHGLRCYKCGWDSTTRPLVGSVSSAIAAAIIQKRLDQGESVEIPSLGIVIRGRKDLRG